MTGAPRSLLFDDIYFSPDDGLLESEHVFLKGNGLPERWHGRPLFTVAELGFGTGLNMLATARRFHDTAGPGQRLHLYSVEKHPLAPAEIAAALKPWGDALRPFLPRLLADYPLRTGGWHTVHLSPAIRLTVIFDDIAPALSGLHEKIDAWYLDGFAPAKNPDMWTQNIFDTMARLSRDGAGFATFTAAGHVKRGLAQAGFDVIKTDGFGRKRDMLTGRIARGRLSIPDAPAASALRVGVIGSGLAGSLAACALRRAGHDATVLTDPALEKTAASRNTSGMVNPRFFKTRSAMAEFFMSGFAALERELRQQGDNAQWRQTGALHLCIDDSKREKLAGATARWGWHEDHMRLVDAAQASHIAGIPLDGDALFLPQAGLLNPAALCDALGAQAISHRAERLHAKDGQWMVGGHAFDAVILANSMDAARLSPAPLPLRTLGGQVSFFTANEASAKLRCNLHYGGYLAVAQNGRHAAGSTFHRDETAPSVKDSDNAHNRETLCRHVPALSGIGPAMDARAAIRVNSADSNPLIGRIDGDHPPLFVSAAHGSHGIISAFLGGIVLSDMLSHLAPALPVATLSAISPARFQAVEQHGIKETA